MPTALGLSESATRQVVSAAGMAPSLFNTQPWQFRLSPDRIEVHTDLGRRLIGHDPEDRELRIACGAALFNLRLALHAHGVTPVVTVEPGDLPEALAVIRRGPVSVQSRDDAALHQAITRRRTNRQPFLDAPTPASDRRLLIRAAAEEHAVLHVMSDHAGRSELRAIVAAADQRQRDTAVCQAELDAWTGFGNTRPDGVPLAAAGPKPEPEAPWASRDLGHGLSRVRVLGRPVRTQPMVVVLATISDRPADQVQAGQALQRVLLNATALGLTASFLSQPIEVTEQHRQLATLLANRLHPQAILRLGFSPPVTAATPRRDAADLLLAQTPAGRP
jgi:nitroreductase